MIIEHLLCTKGERNGNRLQYSCLGNPMDRGTWSMESQRHDLVTKQTNKTMN